ncbi:MAG TPA: S41 family peptidase, partial [Candidatus Polarisedimenticolia bacterium]|nr:S41 family peptidase [Candidatus Polarisedimenticolia bacterium]
PTAAAASTPTSRSASAASPQRDVVAEVIKLVDAYYVFPEKRPAIVAALRTAEKAGRYDTQDPKELSARLTGDLSAAGHDKHLWVKYDPDGFKERSNPAVDVDDTPWSLATAKRRNDGYEEMRILDGNVRYLKVTNFMWLNDRTGRVIDAAAAFLAEGDAIVIDLRGDGGGDGRAVQYLVSHFFDRDRLLITFDDRMDKTTTESRVLGYLPAGRLTGKPMFTLIDEGTASAAEEFAYHVAQFKLGTLVGTTTAGAANNNSIFAVAPGFLVSVSTGRPVHPISGTNWEGVGVKPDDEVPGPKALDEAHLLALKRLAGSGDPSRRDDYAWSIAGLEARVHPYSLAGVNLAAYAGRYGIRSVRVEGEGLVYQRDGREPSRLVPMAPDLFAFPDTDDVRVRFRRAGDKVVGFDQITSDHQTLPSERTD